MASELERFRDHARDMSGAEHVTDCSAIVPNRWGYHDRVQPDPACTGCISDTDRALWLRLAQEIDDYLGPDDTPALWEDTTA